MGGPFYTRLAYTSMMRGDSGRALYRALTEIIISDRVAFFSLLSLFLYMGVCVYCAWGSIKFHATIFFGDLVYRQ